METIATIKLDTADLEQKVKSMYRAGFKGLWCEKCFIDCSEKIKSFFLKRGVAKKHQEKSKCQVRMALVAGS